MVTSAIVFPVSPAASTDGTASTVPLTPAMAIVSAIRPKPLDSSSLPNSITDDASLAQAVAYAKQKLGMADSLFAEAETLLRRSSVSLFYAGQGLGMIRDYHKSTLHGSWTEWLKTQGLAESSVSEAIRFYASAIAKWSTLPACEKELSMLNRTQAKIVLEVVKPQTKHKAGPPPTEAEIKVVAEYAAKLEAEAATEDKKKPIVEIPPPEPIIIDHQAKPEKTKAEIVAECEAVYTEIHSGDGTLGLAVFMNYIEAETDDLAIFGLQQIVHFMNDLQPIISSDTNRQRFTPLLSEIEEKLAKLLVA